MAKSRCVPIWHGDIVGKGGELRPSSGWGRIWKRVVPKPSSTRRGSSGYCVDGADGVSELDLLYDNPVDAATCACTEEEPGALRLFKDGTAAFFPLDDDIMYLKIYEQ
ncbi:hypothetical protein GOBAR_AA14371 [Gossypium barbadense]|uniref:Uncharacterized protein n=1 Tax=Gossypium barbadense TaxID=3634 RepID=A0A2P5XSE2_GOSBA|nr:hypothetical protein GOBAR_AA14371 [Gossypium barbadense]